jgi:hypothetical protein
MLGRSGSLWTWNRRWGDIYGAGPRKRVLEQWLWRQEVGPLQVYEDVVEGREVKTRWRWKLGGNENWPIELPPRGDPGRVQR